jgi:hypothetical protein
MDHVEEREFVLRLQFRCAFPEGYEGDADGYAWADELGPLTSELARVAGQLLAANPGWRVRAANRGRPTEEEITLVVERAP